MPLSTQSEIGLTSHSAMFLLRRVLPQTEPPSNGTKLPPAKVYDIETSTDKSARMFKHLIRANHVNRALVSRDPLNINLATQVSEGGFPSTISSLSRRLI